MTLDPREYEALRRMSPRRKLDVMRALIRQAYALKRAAIRASNPELSESEIEERAARQVAGDRP